MWRGWEREGGKASLIKWSELIISGYDAETDFSDGFCTLVKDPFLHTGIFLVLTFFPSLVNFSLYHSGMSSLSSDIFTLSFGIRC